MSQPIVSVLCLLGLTKFWPIRPFRRPLRFRRLIDDCRASRRRQLLTVSF
jgi:hypothetical protein